MRSPSGPRIVPPSGRTRYATANSANVKATFAFSFPPGKKFIAM
jgi:hypothetical protein